MTVTLLVRRKLGALCFAVGGVGFFLTGALHPHVDGPTDYRVVLSTMMSAPVWVAAHEIAIVTGLVLATALWLLIDADFGRESLWSDVGSRLALVATMFMSAEFSVEAAAKASPVLLALVDPMQTIGWPALCLGYALLAAGAKNAAPFAVRCVGVVGAAAMGLAGILVVGLHVLNLEPLFLGGFLLALWMMWAGVRTSIAASRQNVESMEVK